MPVQEQTPYIKYVANGVTQTFSTEFDCESKDQLVVMLNGEEPAFTSWSYADKQVTFVTAPVVNTVVELKRQSKLNRTTDYQSFNHTLNYKALNSDFDRIWYAIQEQNYKAGQYDYDYNFVLTQVRPINTGGTGADNPVSARNNLNVYSKAQVDALVATGGQGSVVPIDGGGTGADNAEDARANLDVYSKSESGDLVPPATETLKGKAKIATTAIAQAGVNDTDFITPKKFSQFSTGFGQTLKNVTASRVLGVTYTNPTDKTIFIRVLSTRITNTSLNFKVTIDSDIFFSPISSTGSRAQAFVDFYPVPPRSTYKVENGDSGGMAVILSWWEYS